MSERPTKLRAQRARSAGFTLQEIMIALVILSIVAAYALPSYQQSLRTAKRSDAYAALTAVADAQEIAYNNQAVPRSYTTDLAGLGLASVSEGGYYNLGVTACAGGTLDDCFEVRATAREDGSQWGDHGCRWLSLDSRGRRSSGPNSDGCWRD
jgi:type IV pilus assembly protein PilE